MQVIIWFCKEIVRIHVIFVRKGAFSVILNEVKDLHAAGVSPLRKTLIASRFSDSSHSLRMTCGRGSHTSINKST